MNLYIFDAFVCELEKISMKLPSATAMYKWLAPKQLSITKPQIKVPGSSVGKPGQIAQAVKPPKPPKIGTPAGRIPSTPSGASTMTSTTKL